MTLSEALAEIRRVGTIRAESGKLKVRFPETERASLETAIETLRLSRLAALEQTAGPAVISPSECRSESGELWLSPAEWKARELNRLFFDQGLTGQMGCIKAATVRHGERSRD